MEEIYDLSQHQRRVGFSEAVKRAFCNYANFNGRASRSEYWYFTLFCVIVSCAFSILSALTGKIHVVYVIVSIISYLFCVAIIIPGLAITWRRLHDIGRAGGYYFIGLIPIVGSIILLVWECKASQPFANRFGPVPNLSE